MRVEYNQEDDVAYIYLADVIEFGEAQTQVVVESEDISGDVILDLDGQGRLLGIEIIGAAQILPPSLLGDSQETDDPSAEPPGPSEHGRG